MNERTIVMDLARLGVSVESKGVTATASELKTLSGAAKTAETNVKSLGSQSGRVSTSMKTASAAVQANNMALQINAKNSRNAAFQQRNLVFQLNDVAVSLVSGMNPLMVAAQQGSQISTIYGPNEGGIGRAFKETGNLAKVAASRALGLATAFPVLTAATIASAAVLGGLTYEINKTSDVSVSLGNVFMATAQLIGEGIMGIIGPAVSWMSGHIATVWTQIVGEFKAGGNFIIGAMVGTYNTIVGHWDNLPAAFGDIAYSAANSFLAGIAHMLTKATTEFNLFMKSTQKMFKGAGIDINVPQLENTGWFSKLKVANPYSGQGDGVRDEFSKSMSVDYMGNAFNSVRDRAVKLAQEGLEPVKTKAEQAGKSLKDAADKSTKAWKAVKEPVNEAFQFASSTAKGFFSDLRSGIQEGKGLWGSFKDAALNALGKISDKLFDMALNSAFGGSGQSSGGGIFGKIFGGLFGGGGSGAATSLFQAGMGGLFAKGGVTNQPAIFGEAGPEAAVPLPDGRSIPVTLKSPANANTQQNITITHHYVGGGEWRAESEQIANDTVRRSSPSIVKASVNAAHKNFPAMSADAGRRRG